MWRCKKCRTFVNPIDSKHEDFLIKDIKKPSVASGYLLAVITIILIYIITEGNIFISPIFSFFVICGSFLPAFGATLILVDKFKIGGIILATGSIILIPLGLLGVYYGVQSFHLADKLTQNEEFKIENRKYINDK